MIPSHEWILLMEDSPDDAFLLERAFRRAGVPNPLHVVQDGERALEYLEGRGPYADRGTWPLPVLALLDLRLPRCSGLEVLERVRTRPGLKRLPIVVLTSACEPADVARAYDLGANSLLLKPMGSDALQKMVTQIAAWWLEHNERADLGAARTPDLHPSAA
ncbi:MAG TPA: response regulator [Candidatus Eisenbacteria bacterium]|nr:response regulator [Candidatus Eisenbacteria bacterium]